MVVLIDHTFTVKSYHKPELDGTSLVGLIGN